MRRPMNTLCICGLSRALHEAGSPVTRDHFFLPETTEPPSPEARSRSALTPASSSEDRGVLAVNGPGGEA